MLRIRDFTVGNTITASVAIYKQNWRQYLKLSFIAHLWLLVPIYGWARYFAIAAWISKLSLQKLDSELNNLHFSRYFSVRSLCIFSFTGIFAISVPITIGYLSTFVFTCIVIGLGEIILPFSPLEILRDIALNQENSRYFFIGYFWFIFYCLISLWFYARLFITDLTFIERANNGLFYLIKQSYSLTKNNKLKTSLIILLSCLITFPIWIVCYLIAPLTIWLIITTTSINTVDYFSPLLEICFIITLVCAHVIVLPFWQSVKASVFYQLTRNSNNQSVR